MWCVCGCRRVNITLAKMIRVRAGRPWAETQCAAHVSQRGQAAGDACLRLHTHQPAPCLGPQRRVLLLEAWVSWCRGKLTPPPALLHQCAGGGVSLPLHPRARTCLGVLSFATSFALLTAAAVCLDNGILPHFSQVMLLSLQLATDLVIDTMAGRRIAQNATSSRLLLQYFVFPGLSRAERTLARWRMACESSNPWPTR